MSGRFTRMYTWRELVRLYRLTDAAPPTNLQPRYNICPTTMIDAVIQRGASRELVSMRWGLVPSWWEKPLKELRLARSSLICDAFRRSPRGVFLMKAAIFAICGLWLFVSAAGAQNNSELARCRAVADTTARLKCYDALVPTNVSAPALTGKYASISLTDLKLDRAIMRGKKIETSGFLQVMGEMVFLKGDPMDMSPILVDVTHVSREGRKLALECDAGCRATVRGTVGPVLMQPGIIADSIGQP